MISSSMSEFILAMISAGWPDVGPPPLAGDQFEKPFAASPVGAMTSFFSRGGSE